MLEINKRERFVVFFLITAVCVSILIGLVMIFVTAKDAKVKPESDIILNSGMLQPKRDGIMIINISGPIQFGAQSSVFEVSPRGADYVIQKLKFAAENKNVKGVLLRINSPGGTIGSVQEIYGAIKKLKGQNVKIVASMADMAASGGYYIAAGADKIVANPGTITGSIGVIIAGMNLKELFNKIGVKYNIFKSGKHKDTLASYRDLNPEESVLLQGIVDNAYSQFLRVVSEGRNIPVAQLSQLADGRIFTGEQALNYKLIDKLGSLDDAIKELGVLANLGDKPYIIEERITPWQQFFGLMDSKSKFDKVVSMVETSVPVQYLYVP